VGDDQFIQNFFSYALSRTPTGGEQTYWDDVVRAAYPQGTNAVLLGARELGMTLFESAEYAARNRSDTDYVYDLYWTYLMRYPDYGGWQFWTSQVPSMGRENVRHAFDESTEFINLIATITPNGSVTGNQTSLSSARVDPNNESGNQLLARDCEWSVGILSLPGRSGLDLGLGLSYSSAAVWTRSGPSDHPYLYFDEDRSWPSPGFRLGLPVIQLPYLDAQSGRSIYMLTTSAGQRVELRQVGTSNVYEAADSAYLQLTDNGSTLLVRATDGTQMTYQRFENEWKVTQIKDRNGNYMSVSYNAQGTSGQYDIHTITDTLNRTITFIYDGYNNVTSITQTWSGTTHTWATFSWGSNLTMDTTGFTGINVVGTHNGESIPVLRQVSLDDGSYYTFDYSGAAQVTTIHRYTSDNVQRAYTAYNYDGSNSDCPRITASRVWAESWTGINGLPSEVTTQFGVDGDSGHRMTLPDSTVYKEYYGSSTSWQRGLTTTAKSYASVSDANSDSWKKETITSWTQDSTGVNYQTNPRVTESNIYDGSNHRRTRVGAWATLTLSPDNAIATFPSDVYEYDANASTVLRRSHTDYSPQGLATYLGKHIIGLPSAKYVCDGAQGETPCNDYSGSSILSKVTFQYDEGSLSYQGYTVQHDDSNYGTGFLAGRGNLTSMRRYNVPSLSSSTINSAIYNTAGSTISATDASGHVSNISYSDSFSDNTNHSAFAYPTTLTDADNFSSSVQYNYDFGAKTRVQDPLGAAQTVTYDSAARVDRVTTTYNGAYTRYVYGAYYTQTWSTVNNVADESYNFQIFDGVGHVYGSAGYHPGSSGGYKGQMTQHDSMGRVMKQSNPTEMTPSWQAYGDDSAGWYYTQQSYDWKGRPLVTTNTDNSTKSASYAGCGCAGGEVVTLTDEVNRQQKIYSDVLGRQWKTEIFNWDNSTVYSTGVSVYNARDQVTNVKQYSGAAPGDASSTNTAASCPTGTCQETTMTYDGYARLQTKHAPEQNAGASTSYAYYNDDTINSVTDARSASATYSYNGRHLVTLISYSAPGGITATPNVSFGYDAAGNRTSMTDGFGSKSYSYNQLSQLMSEMRTFNDPNNGNINGVSKTLSYDYNLAGELKKITDPTNMTINYAFDTAGRVTGVTGADSLYAGVSNYASSFTYRAWDAAKHLSYGNSLTLDLSYNNRLEATEYDLKTGGGSFVMGQQYSYYGDGRLNASTDLTNSNLNRGYGYDGAGRLSSGTTANGSLTGPYSQTYGYDAWDNMNNRSWRTFYYNQYCQCMAPTTNSSSSTYSNNRNTATGWNYDADGRLQASSESGVSFTYSFDAASQLIASTEPGRTLGQGLDGDGLRTKWIENNVTTYYVRSSALGGQTIVELDQYGNKLRGYVYGDGQEIAKQEGGQVLWDQRDVSGVSMRLTNSSGAVSSKIETDPLETQVSDSSEFNYNGGGSGYGLNPNGFYGDPTMPNMGCREDGFEADCNKVQRDLSEGIAAQCPNNNCSPMSSNGQWYFYRYTANGAGWMTNNQFFGVPLARPTLTSSNRDRQFGDEELPLHSPHYLPFNIAPQKRGFVDFGRVQDCAKQMFHVENAALDWRPEEGIMRFVFFDPAQGPGFLARHGIIGDATSGWFNVSPDLSMDLVQISHKNPFAGMSGGIARGFVSPDNPEHPYLPNDMNFSGQPFYGLFVHELGNALAFLTNKMHVGKFGDLIFDDRSIAPSDDQRRRWGSPLHNDAGVTFEDCVFGKPVSQQ